MHVLDISFDDYLNTKSFKIKDMSVYEDNLLFKNAIVEITPPGFDSAVPFFVNKNFTLVVNSNLLKLNSKPITPVPALPDGVYKLRYSISPNLTKKIEYYYFRTVALTNKYLDALVKLKNNRVNYTKKQFQDKFRELMELNEFIKGAKFNVEDNHDLKKGIEMYKEINTSLSNFKYCSEC